MSKASPKIQTDMGFIDRMYVPSMTGHYTTVAIPLVGVWETNVDINLSTRYLP
jgi:hypothetical protein